jgi:hypothetical protein
VRTTCEKREDILDEIWTGGNFPPMTKGGSFSTREARMQIEIGLRSIEAVVGALKETLLKMKRAANRLKDLADLEALEKIAPYKK